MHRVDVAIVRPPAASFAEGLTTAGLGAPDLDLAREQHESYCATLEELGVELVVLEPDDAFPDSTFVEDTAVVTDAGVVITRPGAPSRRGETAAVADALRRLGAPLRTLSGPGTVDGGDVCDVGDRFLIGRSDRTDADGAQQLAEALRALGATSEEVAVPASGGLLHLKSGLSWLGADVVAVVAELADQPALAPCRRIVVADDEAYAANCIALNGAVVVPEGFPRFAGDLRAAGFDVRTVAVSEFRRMDGGVSCLSIRLPAGALRPR